MKRDEGRRLTDAELEALEKRIREMYGGAAKNLQQIIDEYFSNFRLRDEEMQKLIGTIVNGREWTEEDYKQWRLAQMGRGERFEALRDKLAERLTNANEVAISYVNDATPGIYTLNRNYAAYEVSDAGGDFTLYDEQTVRRLIVEKPDLMPYYPKAKAVRRNIDLEYGKKQITNAVTSGILMGRSIREIAADLRRRITDMEIESAIRAARTAVTAAENGGRQATYEKAAAMGIDMEREWIATKDHRTRKWHGIADGQRVCMEEAFTVGGEKLMFPGDTSHGASGWNIYNCRCSVKAVVKGHGRKRETYTEWLEKKMAEDPEGTTLAFKKAARRSADYSQWQEYRKIVGDNVPKAFDDFQNFKYTDPGKWKYVKGLKRYITDVPEATQKDYDYYIAVKATGITGTVRVPPVTIEVERLVFNDEHAKRHGCSLEDAQSYVRNAKCSVSRKRWDGESLNFYSFDGATYVNPETMAIKTSYGKKDFDQQTTAMMEVFE